MNPRQTLCTMLVAILLHLDATFIVFAQMCDSSNIQAPAPYDQAEMVRSETDYLVVAPEFTVTAGFETACPFSRYFASTSKDNKDAGAPTYVSNPT